MERRVLRREQIHAQLNEVFNHPLTLVTAAMGYGKTTAVRDFIKQQQTNHLWLNVENDETSPQQLWHSLTRQMEQVAPDFGHKLNAWGFPTDSAQRDRVMDYIEDQLYGSGTILVIDDYHHVHSPEVDELMERMVRKNIPDFHVVILSRVRPGFRVEELILKGLCFQLKNGLFELTEKEVHDFFSLFGYDLPEHETRQVYEVSEGWITAVYLMMKSYTEKGFFDQETDINSLLDQAVFSHYQQEEAHLLTSLSFLDSFTPRQAVYVTGQKDAAVMFRKLCLDNSLIHYDSSSGCYKMHNILGAYLQEKLRVTMDDNQQNLLYRRAGEWEISRHNLLAGLQYFLKAGEYDSIMSTLETPGISRVLDAAPEEMASIFQQVPQQVRNRHPMGYITYIDFYMTDMDMEEGTRLLDEAEDYYLHHQGISPEERRKIMGEIALVRSFSCFNDMRCMSTYHQKAHELLEGRSAIANREMIFTFGSPHVLYLFYREKGDLWGITSFSQKAIHYYESLSNGCGAGFQHLCRAEYYLETGALDQVEPHARKAIYKAQSFDQLSIILCARLSLARLYAARGLFPKARHELSGLNEMVEAYHNPILHNTLELCQGYLASILGDPSGFAPWLKEGDMKHSDILYQGMAFNYLVHAKSVLLEGDYLKLEILCEELAQLFSIFNQLLGFVHGYALEAIAKYKLYGFAAARPALLQALEIGRADGLVLPFAEYGGEILEPLTSLRQEHPEDEYLAKLMTAAEYYQKNLCLNHQALKPSSVLSQREKEILRMVVAGNTNPEIAKNLYVAEVTVKKTVSSIYRKLHVNGRAAAVRRALELGMDVNEP